MENNKGFKVAAIVALFVSIIGVSVAFAALAQKLTIDGSGFVTPAVWDIHFEKVENVSTEKKGSYSTTPTLGANNKIINYGFILTAPGDSVSFTFDIVNAGGLDAKINKIDGINKNKWEYAAVIKDDTSGSYVEDTARNEEDKAADLLLVPANLEFSLVYFDPATNVATTVPTLNDELKAGQKVTLKLTVTYAESAIGVPTGPVQVTPEAIQFNYIQDNQ